MKFKDEPKRLRFKASPVIHERYGDKPIIVLYREEVEAVRENIVSEDLLEGFYDWLDGWEKFIFTSANFVIKSKRKGEDALYAAYSVIADKIRISIFSSLDDDSVVFWVDPSEIDYTDLHSGISSVEERWLGYVKSPLPFLLSEETLGQLKIDSAEYKRAMEEEMDDAPSDTELPSSKLHKKEQLRIAKEKIRKTKGEIRVIDGQLARLKQLRKEMDDKEGLLWVEACAHVSQYILCSLYYFHVRNPHIHVDTIDVSGSSGNGHVQRNDLRNPIRKLTQVTVVRPKTGTVHFFQNERNRLTESWDVKGHTRVYKSDRYKNVKGQETWIKPQTRGIGKKRLAIYAEGAGQEVLDSNE